MRNFRLIRNAKISRKNNAKISQKKKANLCEISKLNKMQFFCEISLKKNKIQNEYLRFSRNVSFAQTLDYRPNENKTDLGWFQWRIRLNAESCSHQIPECANSNHKNLPNTILNRFYKLNSVEN